MCFTLKFYDKVFLCDWQGAVRRAILYADSSCFTYSFTYVFVFHKCVYSDFVFIFAEDYANKYDYFFHINENRKEILHVINRLGEMLVFYDIEGDIDHWATYVDKVIGKIFQIQLSPAISRLRLNIFY